MKFLSSVLVLVILNSCSAEDKTKEIVEEMLPIVRFDRPDAAILKGVLIPEGRSYFLTSGLVASVKNPDAQTGTNERYGNTYEQSVGTLEKIKEILSEGGYLMEDVVFLRVYLAPDKDGEIHWEDWFKAYGEYFNTTGNANKVARSTIAVHSLANPDLLIEIEATAAR